jgi:hypothetical protein
MAPDPTYDDLVPLIAAIDDSGAQLLVTFRCPVTGNEVQARGDWPQAGLKGKATRQASATASAIVRDRLASSIRRATMGSGFGAMGAHAATGALLGKGATTNKTPDRSEEAKHAAVVDAFESVVDLFGWDETGGRWVAASAVPAPAPGSPAAAGASGMSGRAAFFAHVSAHPITAPHDLDVFVRMLAAVIAMDGQIGDDERQIFATLVGPGHDLDALAARGSPGEADMAATSAGPTRETLLLLAWAVALTDEDLGDGEKALLDWFGRALYLPADRIEALRALAAAQVATS